MGRRNVVKTEEPAGAGRKGAQWAWRIGFYGASITLGWLMFQDLESEVVGGIGVTLMLVLLFMKAPAGVAMALPGALGVLSLGGTRQLAATFQRVPFEAVASWSLSVLPMFIFMGLMLWRSGATERLYTAARHWMGWVPGGLAVATNFAGAGLGAVSGSTLGVAYALGRIGVPEMLRAGYDRRLATGAILMAGTGGQLIPPSILLVVYAGIAQVPVGPQLLAGLAPGVILALLYGTLIVFLAVVFPQLVGKQRGSPESMEADHKSSWNDRFTSLARVWPVPVLAIVVVGGLYMGVFTATEAGAVGAFGSLVIAVWSLDLLGFRASLQRALGDTVATCGAIFFLFIGSLIFNRLLVMSGTAGWMTAWIEGLGLERIGFMLVLLVLYLVLGMFMDPLTMMLVTVPILMPAVVAMDISLFWFGVFVVFLGELAIITPPVGLLTFVVHTIVQDRDVNLGTEITLGSVFQSVLWFLPVSFVLLLLLMFFPGLTDWVA